MGNAGAVLAATCHRAATAQLERGGSLVDAMIAASAVLTVVLPHASARWAAAP